MKFEKSCGVIVYRYNNGSTEFLAVKSKAFGHWGFPKGHVENGESEEETAKREVLEETGLEIGICSGFREGIEYSPKEGIIKEVIYYIGKSQGSDVNIQQEEIEDYRWLNFHEMFEMLTFENDKKILTEAKDFLTKDYPLIYS
jgi:tRNA nucleotidyltransferase (CCA-adding enzyme)